MSEAAPGLEDQLIEDIAGFTHNPLGYALYAYPWGEGELANHDGPRIWQREVMQDISDHLSNPDTRYEPLLISIASGHGIGKAQRCDDLAITPAGIVRWGNLALGDWVFGVDGRPTKITGTQRYDSAPMYRVTFDDRSYLDVSSGHLWNVRGRQERRTGTNTWRTMETLGIIEAGVKRSNGKALARQWEIPIQGAVTFESRSVPADPYMLGIWIGDGNKGSSRYSKPDREIVDKLESRGIAVTTHACGVAHTLRKQNTGLKATGLIVLGSHERYIPDDYKFNTIDVRMDLLCGLLDTDGEAHASGSIGYSTTSARLADDIIWLARSLGCKAMLQRTIKKPMYNDANGNKVPGRDCYRVTINAPFNPFSITHKRAGYRPSESRYLTRWIDSIEPIGEMPAMCITVDADDGLYQGRDFIVTHNSAEMGMVMGWAMSTCEDCKIVVTANTENQLRTKTWPEIAKWQRLAINQHWFNTTATAVKSTDPQHDSAWKADAVPWSENNTEAFAGLHNVGKRIILIFDEASNIADKVWEVAEGALTDENTEIIWLAFGNPTRNSGRFRECFRKYRHRWRCKQIDSRNVEGTNKIQIQKWIDDYGEDSDFCKVRVRGLFPDSSEKQFIPTGLTDEAVHREVTLSQVAHAPVIIGVDPAHQGADGAVIYLRQGLHCKKLGEYQRTTDDVWFAKIIAQFEDEYQADAVFIDYGFGTGVKSIGDNWGRTWQLIQFGGASSDPEMANKRGEMYNSAKKWLKVGGALDSQQLADELSAAEFSVVLKTSKIILEPKEDIKERLGKSPGDADAFVLTFAFPVMKKDRGPGAEFRRGKVVTEYDPFA